MSGVFIDSFRETNYENVLAFGSNSTGRSTYYKAQKQKVIFVPEKSPPIHLTSDIQNINIDLNELPLVSPNGSFASQRKWD